MGTRYSRGLGCMGLGLGFRVLDLGCMGARYRGSEFRVYGFRV